MTGRCGSGARGEAPAGHVVCVVWSLAWLAVLATDALAGKPNAVVSVGNKRLSLEIFQGNPHGAVVVARDALALTHTTADGRQMVCVIPSAGDAPRFDEGDGAKRVRDELVTARGTDGQGADATDRLALSLFGALAGKCMRYEAGWWQYELCFGGRLRQFHGTSQNNILGEYSEAATRLLAEKQRRARHEAMAASPTGRVPMGLVTQVYTQGSTCDVTGKPRQTIVVFVCRTTDAASVVLSAIEELEVCSYRLTVQTSLACVPGESQQAQPSSAPLPHVTGDLDTQIVHVRCVDVTTK